MKKIVISIFLFLIPIFINASTIDKLYIDSEIDISGNLIIKEIVDIKDVNETFDIYYLNDIKDIYKASNIVLDEVGVLDDIKDISHFYKDDFDNYVSRTKDYDYKKEDGYLKIKFNEKNIYYLEYRILNVIVKYNDASELYFKFFNNNNYDIKEGKVLFRMPFETKIFKTYVHSNSKVEAIRDKDRYAIFIDFKNFKANKYLDLRVLFDRDIYSVAINKDKLLNSNILDIARKEEGSSTIITIVLVISILLILLLIGLIIYSHYKIDVTVHNIKNDKIDKDLKLLILSDLHDRNINDKLINIINKESPDYVIFSGDMIDGRYKNDKFLNKTNIAVDLCNKLKDYNVYYTYGNHEFYITKDESKDYRNRIINTKVNILNNDKVKLSDNINLIGFVPELKYYNRRKHPISNEYMESLVGKINKNKFNILIAHNPLTPYPYARYGVDLTISGHVHGGVVRFPMALLSPEYRFFPKYSAGKYKIKTMDLIVSRGIGYARTIPIRVNNPAEVVIVNLIKK